MINTVKGGNMENYVILADATCDLSENIRSEIGMYDYLPGHVHIDDGRDFPFTLDWSHITRHEFYKLLSSKKCKVDTAPPSIPEYCDKFEKYAREGISVISMSLSSKISSTFNLATIAAEQTKEKYPDFKIYCFDTYRMSGAFGLLVVYAHILRSEGKSFDEVVAFLEENKYRVHQMGPIDDLFFVARRGRITMGKAIMGSFVGVKPMGDCNSEGYTSILANAKGMAKALDITVEYVKRTAVDVEEQYVLVAHSDREEYALRLKGMLEEAISPKKIFLTEVFTGCGANIGPGMVGVYYLGNKISDDLSQEKEVIKNIMGK